MTRPPPAPVPLEAWAQDRIDLRPWLMVGGDGYSKLGRNLLQELLGEFFLIGFPDQIGDGPCTAAVLVGKEAPLGQSPLTSAAFVLVEDELLQQGALESSLDPLLRQGRVVGWSAAKASGQLGQASEPPAWRSAAGLLLLLRHAGVSQVRRLGFDDEFAARPLRPVRSARAPTVHDVLALGGLSCEALF